MLKKYAIILLLLSPLTTAAQRFSQYFSGTMQESFENPAQSIFKVDTTRIMAFNFFIPNLTLTGFTAGNATTTLKQYTFLHTSTYPNLTIGQNRFNTISANTNLYVGMFKIFTDRAGKSEIGLSWQIRGEGTARFTDETAQLFDGGSQFANLASYAGLFNDNYYAQGYHQFSFTYREQLNKEFSLGVKLSALSGIGYDKTTIDNSNVVFDKTNNLVYITLAGQHKTSYTPGNYTSSDAVPNFRNPGLSFSLGVSQHTEDGVYLQYNLKDIGFINWSGSEPRIFNFTRTDTANLNSGNAGNRIYDSVNYIIQQNGENKSFTTVTNGLAEISATKYYWLDWDKKFRYNPVLVGSKSLFYDGYAGALINNVQYGRITLGVIASYDNLKQFNMGGKFMYKTANSEFFIGTEQLLTSYNLARAWRGNPDFINSVNKYTGAGIFFGFAVKFGPEINSPANSDHMPMGEDEGFLKRAFRNIFAKHKPTYSENY